MIIDQRRRRWRIGATMTLCAVGPFVLIYGTTTLIARLRQPPVSPPSVENFSDYIEQGSAGLSNATLPPAREIWPHDSAVDVGRIRMFRDIAVSANHLIVAGDSKLYVIDYESGQLMREIVLPPKFQGLSALRSTGDGATVTAYSFDSGQFGIIDINSETPVREVRSLPTALGQPVFLGAELVSNGAFESEMLRTYSKADRDEDEPTVTRRTGRALFPGLQPKFAKHLNFTSMDVSADGTKIVLAYKWSDRISILDARSFVVERSIAGPVETKLSFGVGDYHGEQVFALDDEAAHSYVDVATTPNAIVALYSGREKRKHGSAMGLGTAVHAFTWDGRLIGEWNLPEPVLDFTIDPSSGQLFALRHRPRPAVLSIDGSALRSTDVKRH